jgi:hypothetical protein
MHAPVSAGYPDDSSGVGVPAQVPVELGALPSGYLHEFADVGSLSGAGRSASHSVSSPLLSAQVGVTVPLKTAAVG